MYIVIIVGIIHREWLERRAAKRSNVSASNSTPGSLVATTQRTTYLRKLIKFKNENEPLSENDISFVPHFGNGAEEGSGSNGLEGVNNGSGSESASTTGDSSIQQIRQTEQHHLHHHHHHSHHGRQSQEQWNFQPHGVHASPQPNAKELLTDDAERYRYDVVSAKDGNRQEAEATRERTEDSLAAGTIQPVTVGDSSDTKPVVYIIAPSGEVRPPEDSQVPVSRLRAGEFPVASASHLNEELTEQINVAVEASHQTPHRNRNDDDSKEATDANPVNNDLSSGSVAATVAPTSVVASSNRKSVPILHPSTGNTSEETFTNGNGTPTGVAHSSVKPPGVEEEHVLTKPTEKDRMGEIDLEPNVVLSSVVPSVNVTVRNLFGPWSNWTSCSRTCGGGVKTQHRSCWKREYCRIAFIYIEIE
uniref:Uncharacterized protein n=1 Tax=Anopheles farauti TaxID=69004 RepID=A0A182QG37_9DIPT